MAKQKTITVELFAPDGTKVRLSEYVSEAKELQAFLQWTRDAGLSPQEPEYPDKYESEWVTDVALRMKRNDDGTETPHVAFYTRNYEKKWMGVYLDSDQDRWQFEAHAGIKIADIPVVQGDSHPQRGSNMIVALPQPMKIERRTYQWGDGDTDKRHYLSRYLSAVRQAPTPQPPPHRNGETPTPQPPTHRNGEGESGSNEAVSQKRDTQSVPSGTNGSGQGNETKNPVPPPPRKEANGSSSRFGKSTPAAPPPRKETSYPNGAEKESDDIPF